MDAYYITFHSMTQAQRAATTLQRYSYSAVFLRAPKAISMTGCGYAVQVSLSDVYGAIFALRNEGIMPKKVVQTMRDGTVKEVAL